MKRQIAKMTEQEWIDIIDYLRHNVSDSYAQELADALAYQTVIKSIKEEVA